MSNVCLQSAFPLKALLLTFKSVMLFMKKIGGKLKTETSSNVKLLLESESNANISTKAVRNFSKNSSVLVMQGFPNRESIILV